MISELTPPEAQFLLKPNISNGGDVIKTTLLWLASGGYLRIEERETPGLFRNKMTAYLRPTGKAPPDDPPFIRVLFDVVQAAQADGGSVKSIAKRAMKTFGPGCGKFNTLYIIPRLVDRGLAEVRKFLFVRGTGLTAAGRAEAARIRSRLTEAETIPALLQSNPAQAAELAASLGALMLLAPGVLPHCKPLGDALRQSGGDAVFVGDTGSFHHGGFDAGSFDFGEFDFGSFASFDSVMSSFDAGFSDGGGGESGGGGGDSGGSS